MWSFLDKMMKIVLNHKYSFADNRIKLWDYDIVNTKCNKSTLEVVIYMNTIINFYIWKYRNEPYYNQNESFQIENLINKIITSVKVRHSLDPFIKNLIEGWKYIRS